MRKLPPVCSLFGLFFLCHVHAEQLPQMRPALLGTGPRSLVNLIDTQSLIKKGQGDAVVWFSCLVSDAGRSYELVTYRGTPGSTALAEEVTEKSDRAMFIPAQYISRTRISLVSGTVVFGVINGKPHLRIYLNQEEEHLKRGDDFISPQPIFWEGDKFKDFEYPKHGLLSGNVGVRLNIDAAGKLKDAKVAFESPAGGGFGDSVMAKIGLVTFLPAYSHGKPVASTTTWQVIFRGGGHGSHWNTDS